MSLDLIGLLLDLPLPTPPRFRGLNMRRRPAPLPPPDEDSDPDASDIDIEAPSAPPSPPTLLFSRWNPSGERMRGLRTLDRFDPSRFFFLDDDGGGDEAILLVEEYAARPEPPPREGISNGDGTGPRDARELRLATAAEPLLEAARNFIVVLDLFSPKMKVAKCRKSNGETVPSGFFN